MVSVVILYYNRPDDVLVCIESVLLQSYQNYELIVVDNGSSVCIRPSEMLKNPKIKQITLRSNYGCVEGRNIAAKYCRYDYILYVDDDAVLNRDSLSSAIQSINTCPNIAVVTGVVCQTDIPSKHLHEQGKSLGSVVQDYSFKGGISLHRKDLFMKAGGYPSDYLYGAEEEYLSIVYLGMGYRILRDDRCIIYHKKILSNRTPLELVSKTTNRIRNIKVFYPYWIVPLLYVKSLLRSHLRAVFVFGDWTVFNSVIINVAKHNEVDKDRRHIYGNVSVYEYLRLKYNNNMRIKNVKCDAAVYLYEVIYG